MANPSRGGDAKPEVSRMRRLGCRPPSVPKHRRCDMTYEPRVPARIRWRIPTALASLATLALLPAAATGAAPGPAPAKASPQLAKLAAKAPQKRLEVLVQLQPGVST